MKKIALACACIVLTAQAAAPLDISKEALFRSLLAKGDTALREGKPGLAHDLYVQAEGQSEESPEADIGQVRADLLGGEFRRASAFALLVSGEHADSAEALAIGAFLEERAGQTDRAIDFLRKALLKDPDAVPLVGALSEILLDRGRYQEAVELLDGWTRRHAPQQDIEALRLRAERVSTRTSNIVAGRQHGVGRWPAPYFEPFPESGKATNGFVIDDGKRVMTLADAVAHARGPIYVRNGLGRLRKAAFEKVDNNGLATLLLEKPYDARSSLFAAAVPGRPASVVGFGVVDSREASWPALTSGLLIRPRGTGPLRISADLPESISGSPVFDPQGHLVGVVSKQKTIAIPVTTSTETPASLPPVPAKELMERVQGSVVVVLIPDQGIAVPGSIRVIRGGNAAGS
jgi:tetratricopeptide (TPR) repeat protein